MKPVASLHFVNLLFQAINATHFDSRSASSFLRRHARSDVLFGEHVEMGAEFFIKIALHIPSKKDVSQETPYFDKERHSSTPRMLLTPARWPRRCGPNASSRLPVASVLPSSIGSTSRADCSLNLPKKRKSSLLPPFGEGQGRASPVSRQTSRECSPGAGERFPARASPRPQGISK